MAAATAGAAVAVALPSDARSDGPPAGATALCKDGTYSFSKTHSGTCSHHGGVAQWLDGSGTATPPATPTTTAPPPPTPGPTTTAPAPTPVATAPTPTTPTPTPHPGTTDTETRLGAINLGKVVYIHKQTKTSHCHLGPNPDRACSPGAYYSGLTKKILCSPSFHTSSIRHVPESEKHQVEIEYGMKPASYGRTLEVDHIVSLELGGSNEIANLFPEKANAAPGYHVKDKLENEAHRWVCAGKITLHAAQVAIATNWEAFYKRVFGVAPQ
jgi:hypothetical protein